MNGILSHPWMKKMEKVYKIDIPFYVYKPNQDDGQSSTSSKSDTVSPSSSQSLKSQTSFPSTNNLIHGKQNYGAPISTDPIN
jgi:hypothetical protein